MRYRIINKENINKIKIDIGLCIFNIVLLTSFSFIFAFWAPSVLKQQMYAISHSKFSSTPYGIDAMHEINITYNMIAILSIVFLILSCCTGHTVAHLLKIKRFISHVLDNKVEVSEVLDIPVSITNYSLDSCNLASVILKEKEGRRGYKMHLSLKELETVLENPDNLYLVGDSYRFSKKRSYITNERLVTR